MVQSQGGPGGGGGRGGRDNRGGGRGGDNRGGGPRGDNRGPRRDRRRGEEDDGPEFIEKVVYINRVAKVVKGGRRFGFTAIVVVGDGQGRVGFGMGRANEVPEAIRKGGQIARRTMFRIPMNEGTIAHDTISNFKATRVLMRPASPGTGMIAGGAVRAVMEAAGVTDVLTKTYGSRNAVNVVRATIDGLKGLRPPERVRAARLAAAAAANA
ncbi:MAG: 30S ribosomal protein S5 [Dehalococcoidia bacterium]|jgi:small subunit ribosomal protein S5|nr:30S ribosomal protein S5 [Dehalococcoidia bacterium]